MAEIDAAANPATDDPTAAAVAEMHQHQQQEQERLLPLCQQQQLQQLQQHQLQQLAQQQQQVLKELQVQLQTEEVLADFGSISLEQSAQQQAYTMPDDEWKNYGTW
eukprot:GHVP01038227.1.p2 GENE.GHVP01038227.1~~GHVP01038227.1.p2  ORF type:complete len:106 (+),score=32.31 GHVP01038227.1:309-626(+)